jgi:protein-S-isoprenylcysteine O-methyltransferase Ste14
VIGKHILLTLVVGAGTAYLAWERAPALWSSLRITGLFLAVAGFALWTTARFQLGTSFTVAARATKLVKHGLYSKIRNPIYFFGSIFLAGYILLLGQPAWLLAFALIIPLQFWRMGREARVLEAKFGDEYRAYRARTWF